MPTLSTAQQRMAAIFNEWAKRYADDPDAFSAILDENGRPVTDYGDCCALYFDQLAADMNLPTTTTK